MKKVAYFCMEYGLTSEFKIYAGGLGILAGDYLKAAKQLGLPVVGIGILWKQGYHEQQITKDNRVIDCYPNYIYDFLKDTGVKVKIKIRQRDVYCKVWQVDSFNNAPLYLLDTDLAENEDPWITGQLYGYFAEERIAQEMVLGIAGVKALRALGLEIDIYHFNEGHAVFAGLELIKEEMNKNNINFKKAWKKVKEKIVFTTHTPVIQGNEEHTHARLQYMGANLNLTIEEMAEIGGAPFNMTVAGLRLAKIANGVSQLHSQTANKMWEDVRKRAKIMGITNGVDHETWIAKDIIENKNNPDKLWETHQKHKQNLIDFVEKKSKKRLKLDSLLIGFARRSVPYKRSDFIFTQEKKVAPLLKEGKLQIIFSGKAHPLDDQGKEMIVRLLKMADKYESVVFLPDYDMEIGANLTCGADLWLNNPRRPKEASGTSGMKAAMNGVLNLSILDGWWPEACQHGINGWSFAHGFDSKDFSGTKKEKLKKQDLHDLTALYEVLFTEVIPMYYQQKEQWIKMMQNSIDSTYHIFSAKRMLQDYYNLMYEK